MIVPLIFNYLCMIVESLPSIIKCQNLCKVIECIYFIQHHLGVLIVFWYFDVLFGNDVWERFNSLLTKHYHSFMVYAGRTVLIQHLNFDTFSYASMLFVSLFAIYYFMMLLIERSILCILLTNLSPTEGLVYICI